MAKFLSRLSSLAPPLRTSSDVKSDYDYEHHIHEHIAYLKELLSSEYASGINGDDSILDSLDPSRHTLSYLFILHFRVYSLRNRTEEPLPNDVIPGGRLWVKLISFLRNFDPIQVRYAGKEWRHIIEFVSQAAQVASKPALAAQPIRDAMLRLDPSCAVFTTTHLLFVRLCLYSRQYTFALSILDKPICHFPSDPEQTDVKHHQAPLCAQHESSMSFITGSSGFSARITYKDYLEYFLYGAMVYMGLKKWDKALHFLGVVISTPVANSISIIMVEAYKKWLLASLLDNGKVIALPGVISSHTNKVYKSLAKPYLALAHAFEGGDYQRLSAEVEVGQSIWRMDNNAGLVFQVLGAFQKSAVVGLGRTFAAITVADVARQASPCAASIKEMESLIASLIMSGVLKGTLLHSQCDVDFTMLRFSKAALASHMSDETHTRVQLVEGSRALAVFAAGIKAGNHVLELSHEHMENLQKSRKRTGSLAKSGVGMTEEPSGFDVDEDIMGDMC